VLTSISAIRRLDEDEARSHRPVRLEGVVTYRRFDEFACFIESEEGGICCMGQPSLKFTFDPGRKIRIEGTTKTGGYATAIGVDRLTDLGPAPLPEPASVTLAQLMSGRWDSGYVEVRGVVRHVALHSTGQCTIDLAADGTRVTATIEKGAAVKPTDWIDSVIRVRGVAGVNSNRSGQLFSAALRVQGMENVVLEEAPPVDPFAAPARPIQSIMKSFSGPVEGRRIKVSGTVLYQQPDGTLYLEDRSGGIMVSCRSAANLRPGDQVEVLGFPVLGDYSPRLEDAIFQRLGPGAPPVPTTITVEHLVESRLDDQLVQLDGKLVAQTHTATEHLLMIKSGNELLPARLVPASDDLLGLRSGSLLRLTGICRAQLKERQFRSGVQPAPVFDLVLRSPRDVVVLQAAPWWNLQRALQLAAGIFALLLLAIG
jgi:hypothetical protein